jgi:hypothetical protein
MIVSRCTCIRHDNCQSRSDGTITAPAAGKPATVPVALWRRQKLSLKIAENVFQMFKSGAVWKGKGQTEGKSCKTLSVASSRNDSQESQLLKKS